MNELETERGGKKLRKVKSRKEYEAIQQEAEAAWKDALDGEPPYIDIEARVIDDQFFEFETPVLHLPLRQALDKPRPIGERVTLRMSKLEIASWDRMFSTFALEEHKCDTVVYVLLMENGTVKIGRSKNFEQRKATISTSSGMIVKKWWRTKKCTRLEAAKIEAGSHKHFKANRIKGEFFNVDFDEACAYVKKLANQRK